jgi:hypothetical protein
MFAGLRLRLVCRGLRSVKATLPCLAMKSFPQSEINMEIIFTGRRDVDLEACSLPVGMGWGSSLLHPRFPP